MERYVVIKEVGYGTFGNVWRAVNKESGEIVAIKKMKKKYYCWEECINLREVKVLRKMNHPNIVKLKEVVREYDMLHFIFEYMDCNLYEFIKDRDDPFSESKIRNWCFQVFQALAYMHQQGYFHRDLKPENLLVSEDVIKVADFGLAREISSMPPFTEYVSTRCFCILKHLMEFYIARAPPEPPWFYAHSGALVKHLVSLYRAPEVLLQSSVYGPAVDIWAMGAIMAELFNLRPLFPGTNEADEIHKICSVIGSPCQNSWAEGLHLADKIKFQFPQYQGINLSILIPSASEYAISLISSLCSWDPLRRPTAAKALQHPFFKPCYYIPPSLRLRDAGISKTPPSVVMRGVPEHLSARRCSVGALTNKPPTNVPSPTAMTTLKTGVAQRKLDMHQYKDYVPYENNSVQPLYRRPAKSNNPGYLGGVSYGAWDLNEKLVHPIISSGRVDDMAEKLANLTMNSGSRSVRPPPPALKAGSWHSNTRYFNRSYEIPPPARGYPRKAVG